MLQAIAQTIALVVDGIAVGAQIDIDFAVAQFDREAVDIVRPEIKGAAAGQVKTGVMPMAAQYAVFDRALIQGKTHVRAAVIQGIEFIAVEEKH